MVDKKPRVAASCHPAGKTSPALDTHTHNYRFTTLTTPRKPERNPPAGGEGHPFFLSTYQVPETTPCSKLLPSAAAQGHTAPCVDGPQDQVPFKGQIRVFDFPQLLLNQLLGPDLCLEGGLQLQPCRHVQLLTPADFPKGILQRQWCRRVVKLFIC